MLRLPNKGLASCVRHIREVVDSFWDFTADVMGAIGVGGVTGTMSAICVAGAPGVTGNGDISIMGGMVTTCVTGASGVTGEAGVTGDTGVTGIAGATGVIYVAGPSGVLGA